jgi:hypothetical protein
MIAEMVAISSGETMSFHTARGWLMIGLQIRRAQIKSALSGNASGAQSQSLASLRNTALRRLGV